MTAGGTPQQAGHFWRTYTGPRGVRSPGVTAVASAGEMIRGNGTPAPAF